MDSQNILSASRLGHGEIPVRDLLPSSDEERVQIQQESMKLKTIVLSARQSCDVELLLNGGFTPLCGFMNKDDYESVIKNMHLTNGTLWPIPITLDVPLDQASKVHVGEEISLKDGEGHLLAIMCVGSIWEPDRMLEAQLVFRTQDEAHPSVNYLKYNSGTHYIGGKLKGYRLPSHYDFQSLRRTPLELRSEFDRLGWSSIVAFQTRNPLHRSHLELTMRAAREANANLLLHPVVGMTKPGDVDHFTRVKCYKSLMSHYPSGLALLSLLPIAMRMGGPKEAIWHAIIRKNYGCTHFIVGRDHAGPGKDSGGIDFYGPYDAHEMVKKHEGELGIKILTFKMVVYAPKTDQYIPEDEVKEGQETKNISGTELRRRLMLGLDIPEWFSFPSVVKILRESYPPKSKQGFTVFLTGLSSSGKSTIANALSVSLSEFTARSITILDGDAVRPHLSTELGFSREHRVLNVKRVSFVASEITKAGGIAIVALIAPYEESRAFAREIISKYGTYLQVYLSTPLQECEERDRKGLYAKARNGQLKSFTGIDDPYEVPQNSQINIDTSKVSIKDCVKQILNYLANEDLIDINS